jgi:hypothetical protein
MHIHLAPQSIEALAIVISGGGGNDTTPPIGIYRSASTPSLATNSCGGTNSRKTSTNSTNQNNVRLFFGDAFRAVAARRIDRRRVAHHDPARSIRQAFDIVDEALERMPCRIESQRLPEPGFAPAKVSLFGRELRFELLAAAI